MTWQPIETAPRDGTTALVNDTTPNPTHWLPVPPPPGDADPGLTPGEGYDTDAAGTARG